MKLLLLSLCLCCGCATTVVTHGIPNLRQVAPNVWRGGQPTAEGWAWLKSQGIGIDVKLNAGRDNGGVPEIDIPVSFWEQMIGPPKSKIELASSFWTLSEKKVFIHCTHGQDRTGLVIAEYRVNSEGWTRKAARKEMLENGFHRCLLGLDWYWRTKQ